MTRDLDVARKWLRGKARGTERCGLTASSSSGAYRLKPLGVFVKNQIDPKNWFLEDKTDVRSSYYLEDIATEFDIQGLELDWTCVLWGANFRYDEGKWIYKNFRGTVWQGINDDKRKMYLKNAHRVLLTRARQGMVIFVPEGDDADDTRKKAFYDTTYEYLKDVGIKCI